MNLFAFWACHKISGLYLDAVLDLHVSETNLDGSCALFSGKAEQRLWNMESSLGG
jgi:hypothetical protein